ncbi:transcription factor bHLH112-like isoform X2 [Punica granatum]|uniref:Transcription factor bHLH112-like isoform X2 n=2 Tax=Punica granatum TaxID=22663 RepID=A0A6P8DC06_PUNGR|nr:transcription factor bHLH112-like isoform X2 [Punica granatum]PKI67010.1 hypothetical protein CRG98_012548 [Punica granatum]
MAEEFINQVGVCSGNWWNPSRNALFAGGLSLCSGAAGDVASYGWPVEPNFSSMTSSSSVNSDWTQALLFGGGANNGIRTPSESNFNSNNIMHESGSSDSSQINNDWSPGLPGNFSGKPVEDHEDSSPMSGFRNQISFPTQSSENYANHDISSSCGYPSNMIKSFLLDQAQPSLFENRPNLSAAGYSSPLVPSYGSSCSDESSPASFGKLSSLLTPINSSLPNPPQPSRLQFSNNTPYWNASFSALDDVCAGLFASPQSTLAGGSLDEKPDHSSLTPKATSQYSRVSGSLDKKASPEPAFKRARIETPSPLPTFKVRKEKLGDRITALQQLVSPFGKTDTASVLHEAIEYIKFLHDQVNACTDNKAPKDAEGPKIDLRSRGLCLVPISSTFPVTSETPTDFWNPTFGRSFR